MKAANEFDVASFESPKISATQEPKIAETAASEDYHHVKLKNPYSWYVGTRYGEAR